MAETGKKAAPAQQSRAKGPALDELMMAMDVVDTLRHQEDVALRELAQDGRDETLKERLRQLYESQGLEVSDRILEEGIAALKESRFSYEPTPPGFSRMLAGLWVRRVFFGGILAVLIVFIVAVLGVSVWRQAAAERAAEQARIELTETLPQQITAAANAALAEAKTENAVDRIEQLQADGTSALTRSDAAAARVALQGLQRVYEALAEVYTLRIVSRPGEQSGVYRIPDVNNDARNYYLIVEAVGADGKLLSFPIRSEEDNRVKTVSKWGVRVPKSTYDAVGRDKQDDGIIQDDVLAIKPRGALEPVYEMSVSDGAITEW